MRGLRGCCRLATLDLARNRLHALDALPAELAAPLRSLCLVGNPLIQAVRCVDPKTLNPTSTLNLEAHMFRLAGP